MQKQRWLLLWLLLALLLSLAGCGQSTTPTTPCPAPPSSSTPAAPPAFRLLVFSRTAAFRHDSIPAASAALQRLATEHQVSIDFTENPTCFTEDILARYQAVIFLLTTGDVLDDTQQQAFEHYIRAGGGYVGVHSASDTEYDWPWYGRLVGAYFDRVHGHSAVVPATLHTSNHSHPSTTPLPATWRRSDEWYNFATNPRGQVTILLTIDEQTYRGGVMGSDHPLAWYHAYDGGHAWYTALGHTIESYSEPCSRIYPSVDKPQVEPGSCFFRPLGTAFAVGFTRRLRGVPEPAAPQAFCVSEALSASFAKLMAAFKSRSITNPHCWQ